MTGQFEAPFWVEAFDLDRARGQRDWYGLKNLDTKFGQYATLEEATAAAQSNVQAGVVCRVVDNNYMLVSHAFPRETKRAGIYAAIDAERERQIAKWGTGPLPMASEADIYCVSEDAAKARCDRAMAEDRCTHALVIMEECAEVLAAAQAYATAKRFRWSSLSRLRESLTEELVQLAACAVKALEQLGSEGAASV